MCKDFLQYCSTAGTPLDTDCIFHHSSFISCCLPCPATFMSVYEVPHVAGTRPGRELGRHTVGRATQQFWAKLEDFLREGKLWVELSENSCTWLACCSVASNWKQFMSRLLQAFSKVVCVCVCVCVCICVLLRDGLASFA